MFTMRIEGGQELARRLNALPDALSKKVLIEALKLAAEPIAERASDHARRSPFAPHLADNIGIVAANQGLEEKQAAVAIGPTKDFFYGSFLEFNKGYPFMRPAFDETAAQSLGVLVDELWKALRAKAEEGGTHTTGGRFL